MRKGRKAIQHAHMLLREGKVKRVPVDIYRLGALRAEVIERKMPDGISGILIPTPQHPRGKNWAIVVNASHAEVRRRFTVAHELGHCYFMAIQLRMPTLASRFASGQNLSTTAQWLKRSKQISLRPKF